MGEWERAQEGEKEKGKGKSKRRVVRREDAEEEEVVTRVTLEAEESKEEMEKEEGEKFDGEHDLRPGTISQIRDLLSGTGLSGGDSISLEQMYKLLGETLNARDDALEKLDEVMKKEKSNKRKKEKRKKKKKEEKKKAKSPSSDEDEEEMEEEEE